MSMNQYIPFRLIEDTMKKPKKAKAKKAKKPKKTVKNG